MLESLNASLVVFIPADDEEGKKGKFFFLFFFLRLRYSVRIVCMRD